jgi:hypothetical protein
MIWAQLLAYVTGTVDRELLLRNVEVVQEIVPYQASDVQMD